MFTRKDGLKVFLTEIRRLASESEGSGNHSVSSGLFVGENSERQRKSIEDAILEACNDYEAIQPVTIPLRSTASDRVE